MNVIGDDPAGDVFEIDSDAIEYMIFYIFYKWNIHQINFFFFYLRTTCLRVPNNKKKNFIWLTYDLQVPSWM